jgi:hypothetical protein
LEILEDRTLLSFYLFTNAAGGGGWTTPNNWSVWNPSIQRFVQTPNLPGGSDDVGLTAGVVVTIPSGANVEINSIVTASGTTLNVLGGPYAELKIDNNPPSTVPQDFPTTPVAGSNYFGGSVIDSGLINANTTNVFTGTQVIFAGGAVIGPGDLNGNLVAGPNSAFTFDGGGPGAANTFLAGATFGQGAGSVIIASPVSVMGTLEDGTATMVVASGGDLTGPGTVDELAILNWTGGTISLAGGVDVTVTGQLNTSGADPKYLSTVLTNEVYSTLGGSGTVVLLTGGSIVNEVGTLTVSLPSIITTGGGAGITNEALGTLDIPAELSAPVNISVPFTNDGILKVETGSTLALTTPPGPGGTPAIDLNGTVQLDSGTLDLYTLATSTTGFTLYHLPGFFEIGGGPNGPVGSLIVPAGVTDYDQGNLEVTGGSTLTGGGTVYNSGRLQLDVGSSTAGLGYYVQDNSGTLAIVVSGNELYSPLTVVNTATLSGTLVLPGYTGVVGDSFTVVTAGQIEDQFDANGIPNGMEQTETATTASVTQVQPPAGT